MTTKLIINCATGQTSEVELTAEEIAQREADAAAFAEAEAWMLRLLLRHQHKQN
jgi:hypothetical protein